MGPAGASGGGAMLLVVSGVLTNNGSITANGGGAAGSSGGGSGGSIYVTAGKLAGKGAFYANGGASQTSGGGGRIAIYYKTNSSFNSAHVMANGGVGGNAGAGTVKFLIMPTIKWAAPAAITYGTALGGSQLNATASVPGTYAYTPTAGTVLSAGKQTLSVIFTPTEATKYAPATASVTITVNRATPTISWTAPAAITYGTALDSTQLNATVSAPGTTTPLAGTLVYSPAAGAVLAGGSHNLSVTFTPTDTADYATARASVPLVVSAVTPTINWSNPKAITYGTKLSGTQLNAKATYPGVSVPGTFTYTPAAGAILLVGQQSLSASFKPTSAANFNTPADASATLVVNPLTPKIKVTAPPAITFGTPLDLTKLSATVLTLAPGMTTPVDGQFLYSIDGNPVVAVTANPVLAAGSHKIVATFTPSDATNYTTATASTTITVTKAMPAISWNPPPAPIDYGTALSGTQLNASASFGSNSVSGSFTYSPVAGTVLSAGSHTLSATFKPDDGTDYGTPLKATVTLSVGKVLATISWTPSPSSINAGTALVRGQLDAQACSDSSCKTVLTGTWKYGEAAGQKTPTSPGPYTLTGAWTPTGAAATNHLPTPATVDILLLN